MESLLNLRSPPIEDQKRTLTIFFLFFLGSRVTGFSPQLNPHAPQKLTWQVLSQTGEVAWSISRETTPWTWWPPLTPDICALVAGVDTWDIPEFTPAESRTPRYSDQDEGLHSLDPGCRYPFRRRKLQNPTFYVCPRDGRSRSEAWRCGGVECYYCAAWGCETTGNTYWNPRSSWDLITVKRKGGRRDCKNQGWCNPLEISFTEKGQLSRDWIKGRPCNL